MKADIEPKAQITNVLHMVDELENSYDQRLQALQAEYQADIEELLRQYKFERQQFDIINEQQANEIAQLRTSVQTFKELYEKSSVEHKITKDRMNTALAELRTEQELLETAQERINSANAQVKAAIEAKVTPSDLFDPFAKAREFMLQIIDSRLTRPIILQTSDDTTEDVQEEKRESEHDGFSY